MHHKRSFRRSCRRFFFLCCLFCWQSQEFPLLLIQLRLLLQTQQWLYTFWMWGRGVSILVQSQAESPVWRRWPGTFQFRGFLSAEAEYFHHRLYDLLPLWRGPCAGLVGCLDSFSVKNVIGADYVQDTKIYQSFENSVAAQGLTVQHPEPGTDFAFGGGKLQFFLLNRSAATITTILLRSGWKTETTIFFLPGMQNLPGRKRSAIWGLIFPAMWSFRDITVLPLPPPGSAPADCSGVCSDQLRRR